VRRKIIIKDWHAAALLGEPLLPRAARGQEDTAPASNNPCPTGISLTAWHNELEGSRALFTSPAYKPKDFVFSYLGRPRFNSD